MKTLFDTGEERHAFAIGVFEILPPWPSRYRIPEEVLEKFYQEAHYYAAGRGFGAAVLTGLIIWGISAMAGG